MHSVHVPLSADAEDAQFTEVTEDNEEAEEALADKKTEMKK
jgi:hypothetical protein